MLWQGPGPRAQPQIRSLEKKQSEDGAAMLDDVLQLAIWQNSTHYLVCNEEISSY